MVIILNFVVRMIFWCGSQLIRLEESKFLLKAEGDDRYTGFVKYPPGEWIAEVLASDYVGNVQRSQMQLTVLRSFGFEQCFVAPNPEEW